MRSGPHRIRTKYYFLLLLRIFFLIYHQREIKTQMTATPTIRISKPKQKKIIANQVAKKKIAGAETMRNQRVHIIQYGTPQGSSIRTKFRHSIAFIITKA